ncbi:helix-turn-helix domain-containing protein [Leeuwenhoekiella parthenopeia]|uniref:Helix-turn-helix domain-containing protein n=1 Tax=Leeuwenhoekiella parthenopeia TaxID=2890320 RepID=A0ABS8GQJ6_9FLAO|nr:helix-turn-helix domain-containing protein [Leeuwenhoekiella parthenopeia]MCC4212254.1 helix-turn-helix domain-containing protein [Leeuwenhoekiella parthenopeia]
MESTLLLEIENLKKTIEKSTCLNKEYLTLEEAAFFLGISKSALYKKKAMGDINFYQPGGKMIYFKKSELIQWIEKGKLQSVVEVLNESSNYSKS